MTDWKPDRLLRWLLIWTGFTLLAVWLPLVRGLMDGASYQWAFAPGVGGRGVGGTYWLLVILAGYGLLMLSLGWRGARPPFHWLLLLWHLSLAGLVVYASWTAREPMRFRGDTLGIDISIAWMGPVFFGGFALLAVYWVVRDRRAAPPRVAPEWQRTNRVLLLLAALLLPVQFILFRFGEPHGTTDQVGVVLTIGQWLLVNCALVPHSSPAVEVRS